MSDMRKLLESMTKFAGEPEQKPGDQVRGTDKAKKGSKQHPFHGRLVGANESDDNLIEQLMAEYKFFVEQPTANAAPAGNTTSPTPTQTPPGGAPGPGGQPPAAQPATGTAPAGQQPATGTAPAGQQPAGQQPAGTTAAKPGQPAPAGGAQPTGAAGSMTPPNPQQIKKDTDTLAKVMNNPASPLNKELQALIKKAALLPK